MPAAIAAASSGFLSREYAAEWMTRSAPSTREASKPGRSSTPIDERISSV
jgi:hypothetical protein